MDRVAFISFGALILTLIGCAGGGTATANAIHFDAPIVIQDPGTTVDITSVSPHGVMVGNHISPPTPYIWSSPTASPTALDKGAQAVVYATSVNDDGVVAGWYNVLNQALATWQAPTSAPSFFLALPPIGFPHPGCIGPDGTVYAYNYNQVSYPPAGYSVIPPSSSLTPVAGVDVIKCVANDGALYGDQVYAFGQHNGIWDFAQRPIVRWANQTYQYLTAEPKYVNPATHDMIGVSGQQHRFVTSSSDVQIPGATDNSVVVQSISDQRIMVGYRINGDNSHTALIWTSTTAAPVELDTFAPAGSGWHFREANFTLADGSIVGTATHTVGGVATDVNFYMHRIQ